MRNIITIIALSLSLQSCILVVGAAAGAASMAAVYDHRKLEQVSQDQRIANYISNRIKTDPNLGQDTTHIDVTSFNRVVLLSGQTVSPSLRQQAEEIAHRTNDVTKVYNEIAVKGPSSSLTRASDSWITTKIKTEMLATKGLQSGSIKVITENGSVYLMGIVTHEQADISVDIARQVSGVQRVVKIFQYRD